MKLLFIIPSYNGGGAELVFIKLANYLSKHHDTTLFVINPIGHHAGRVANSVNLIESRQRKSRWAWMELFALVRRTRFNKVYATLVFPIILAGFVKVLSRSKSKFIARPANIIQREKGKQKLLFKLYLFFLGKFDCVIAQNHEIKDLVDAKFNQKCVIIPNPVSKYSFDIEPTGGEHFIWVGRISYQKRFDLLIEAAKLTSSVVHAFVKPEEAPIAIQMCNDAGCKNIIVFPFSNEIVDRISEARALIMTSRYEGLSNVMLEALSVGTPVIASRFQGGGHEYLNEFNSVYYDDAAELASLLAKPPKFADRTQIIELIYEKCSLESVGQQYANI